MSISHEEKRAEFSQSVIRIAKERAAYICSNPNCRLMTIGPSASDENLVEYIGEVAHILPAKKKGPRETIPFDPNERSSIDNAIFLCGSCARMIDKNKGIDYPAKTLKEWRTKHYSWIRENINKQLSRTTANETFHNHGNVVFGIQNINYVLPPEPKSENHLLHDQKVFERLIDLCSEESFNNIILKLKESARIRSSEQDKMAEVSKFLKKASNKFIQNSLSQAANILLEKLEELNGLIASNFDRFPYEQTREDYTIEILPYAFHWPGYEVDVAEKQEAHRLLKLLLALCDEVDAKMYDFRIEIKVTLMI
jgi:hypothetical protein